MERTLVPIANLTIGPCPTPRPSDRVCWYQDRNKYCGTLIGHDMHGRPRVRTTFGPESSAESFSCIRLDDGAAPVGPNWTRLPDTAVVVQPAPDERAAFARLLGQRTPPGPKYEDLVFEITKRGYETFLVGGTVRDVITGDPSNDVDLVTSMPLERMFPLINSMYGRPRNLEDIALRNGHLRPGGRPGSGDAYIDLSVFKRSFIGTMNATFGDDFDFDTKNRDFACNSVYYDPINDDLIDPTGNGITDIENRSLRLVADFDLRDPRQLGRLFIRAVKFICRGYALIDECKEQTIHLAEYLPTIDALVRANYIRAQILSKGDARGASAQATFEEFHAGFLALAPSELWDRFIEPIKERILQ